MDKSKFNLKKIFLVILIGILIYSCEKHKQYNLIEKEKCACKENLSPPPPYPNRLMAAQTLFCLNEKVKYVTTFKLISDTLVDNLGVNQQLFKIKAENKFRKQNFYFAFPQKFNRHWNDLSFFKEREKIIVGFSEGNELYALYQISEHEMEEYNRGLISFQPIFKILN
jgi:hypothetical protein